MGGLKIVAESALQTKQDNVVDRIGDIVARHGFSFVTPHKILDQSSKKERVMLVTQTFVKDGVENTFAVAKIPIGHLVENKDRILKYWKVTIYDQDLFHKSDDLHNLTKDLGKIFGTTVRYDFTRHGPVKLEALSGIKRDQ
ncbi:MAG: hypothetical protein KGH53_01770 [Candidatus Micrarchaeota archaeon]|nr:hypothetical protein [Candidatus Micrarchaeota archaeon]